MNKYHLVQKYFYYFFLVVLTLIFIICLERQNRVMYHYATVPPKIIKFRILLA